VIGSHKQAEKRLRELLTELDDGTFVKPVKATLVGALGRGYPTALSPTLPRTY